MVARIVKILSKDYTLQLEDGTRVTAVAMGKIRLQVSPVIGDLVEYEQYDGRYGIVRVLPRRNHLVRPPCANIDQALIVMSIKDPDFSTTLIDRLTFLICNEGIEPLLCVTKTDLGISEEVRAQIEAYKRGPMKVILSNKESLDPALAEVFKDKVTVLTGQSGAGKSTLLNTLEPSFKLATQEISKALGRGKHTTRHSELHEVADGLVADTPGFSSLDFSRMSKEDLALSVLEFRPYIGTCMFNDCVHENEPGCAVKKAVEDGKIEQFRYEHYLEILRMIKNRREKYA